MKTNRLFIVCILALTSIHCSRSSLVEVTPVQKPTHQLDPEMTGPEYEQKIKKEDISLFLGDGPSTDEEKELATYVAFGKKNLQWVEMVNQLRPEGKKISFSSEATQNGNDVYNPRVYNFQVIKSRWAVLKSLLPQPLKAVIFEGGAISPHIPVSEREYLEWLFQVDGAYQITTRYLLLLPYKEEYIASQMYDVRGYLTLKDNAQAATDLVNYANLSDVKQEKYKKALVGICENSEIKREDCVKIFEKALADSKLVEMQAQYMPAAKANYDGFFNIPKIRPDAVWNSSNENLFSIPFANPENESVLNYLKTNIEEEWQWGDWKLVLNFINSTDANTTHVEFKEGALPHVNDLAGSIITMDANAPLSEYDVKWTIRHEYGHVLGFPDCYFEFYDESLDAFVSYQLDITNLMCSRRGHFQQRHFDELKRAYYKAI